MQLIQPIGLRFVSRLSTGAYDWVAADFTIDSAVHTFDMSAIVPHSAKLVMLKLHVASTSATHWAGFGSYLAASRYDCVGTNALAASATHDNQIIVPISKTGLVGYYAVTGTLQMNVVVHGWFK